MKIKYKIFKDYKIAKMSEITGLDLDRYRDVEFSDFWASFINNEKNFCPNDVIRISVRTDDDCPIYPHPIHSIQAVWYKYSETGIKTACLEDFCTIFDNHSGPSSSWNVD